MTSLRLRLSFLIILLCLCSSATRAEVTSVNTNHVAHADGQEAARVATEEVDLEIHLQLLIGSNASTGEGARIPAEWDAALKQLRASLPYANYKMGATFLNRAMTRRPLEVKGIGGVLPLPQSANPYTPSFYQFQLGPSEVKKNAAGQEFLSAPNFRFGMRVPLTTTRVSEGQALPVIQYEDIGITTGLSARLGEPVVVGTLYFGSSGDAVIVLMSVKRISP